MSISKVILILVLSGLGLFIFLMYIALSPTIRNVSSNSAFADFVNKQVTSTSKLFMQQCEKGSYRFISNVVSPDSVTICNRAFDIPIGSTFLIKEFKKYTNNAGSGITSIFVLGECTSPEGNIIDFEYDWGSIDNSKGQSTKLPLAFWQSDEEQQIIFTN
jgi:hypothetical protein